MCESEQLVGLATIPSILIPQRNEGVTKGLSRTCAATVTLSKNRYPFCRKLSIFSTLIGVLYLADTQLKGSSFPHAEIIAFEVFTNLSLDGVREGVGVCLGVVDPVEADVTEGVELIDVVLVDVNDFVGVEVPVNDVVGNGVLVDVDDGVGDEVVVDDVVGNDVLVKVNDEVAVDKNGDVGEGVGVDVDDVVGNGVLVDDVDGDRVAVNDVVGDGVPVDDVVGNGVLVDDVDGDRVAVNDVVGDGVPVDDVVGDGVLVDDIVGDGVLVDDVVGDGVLVDDIVGDGVLVDDVLGDGVPVDDVDGDGVDIGVCETAGMIPVRKYVNSGKSCSTAVQTDESQQLFKFTQNSFPWMRSKSATVPVF